MLVVTTTSKRRGSRTTCAIIASTMRSSRRHLRVSAATARQTSRNRPSPTFSTLALWTTVTRLLRCRRARRRRGRCAAQQMPVIRRSEIATSGVTRISPLPCFHVAVGIKAFGVLPHDDEVEVADLARQPVVGARWPNIGEQVQPLAEELRGVDLAPALVLKFEVIGRAKDQAIGPARILQQGIADRGAAALAALMANNVMPEVKRQQKRSRTASSATSVAAVISGPMPSPGRMRICMAFNPVWPHCFGREARPSAGYLRRSRMRSIGRWSPRQPGCGP